jgi:aminomethyltransferase
LGDDEYFMVPNAATTSKMRKWIESVLQDQELVDMSVDLSAIAVQGPTAKDVVARLTSADLDSLKSFWGAVIRLDGVSAKGAPPKTELLKDRPPMNGEGEGIVAYVSRTGYTGEDGFEIVSENENAVDIWRALLDKGEDLGARPVGLGARDTLRLEKALLLSGTDFDGKQTSVQTGPSWVIDWEHEFIGKHVLEEQKRAGSYDKLICIGAKDRGIPRHGYEIVANGTSVGKVTSGTLSPVLKKGIAMGYVPNEMASLGAAVEIRVRDSLVAAEIVKPPFVKRG